MEVIKLYLLNQEVKELISTIKNASIFWNRKLGNITGTEKKCQKLKHILKISILNKIILMNIEKDFKICLKENIDTHLNYKSSNKLTYVFEK